MVIYSTCLRKAASASACELVCQMGICHSESDVLVVWMQWRAAFRRHILYANTSTSRGQRWQRNNVANADTHLLKCTWYYCSRREWTPITRLYSLETQLYHHHHHHHRPASLSLFVSCSATETFCMRKRTSAWIECVDGDSVREWFKIITLKIAI